MNIFAGVALILGLSIITMTAAQHLLPSPWGFGVGMVICAIIGFTLGRMVKL